MNILFISLGCDKNLVDSEVMLGILAKDGHQMVDDETMADVIIINTCCFIHDAKEESIQNILEMAELKKTGRLKALIVTGCLAQRYKEEIIQEIPEVDAVLGTTSYEEIAHVIDGILSDSPMERGDVRLIMKDVDYLPVTDTHRMVTTGGHFAYLKIAEGCDKFDITLTEDEVQEVVKLMQKISDLDLDLDGLLNAAQSIYDKISTADGGFWAKIRELLQTMIDKIRELF